MNSFSYLEPVCCSMSSSNCCFLTCIQVSQEAGEVVWYSHFFQNFLQFIVIHTVILILTDRILILYQLNYQGSLITQELLCSRVLLRYEKGQRMLLTQTSEGGQRVPPLTSLIEAFTYFFTRPTPTTYILN